MNHIRKKQSVSATALPQQSPVATGTVLKDGSYVIPADMLGRFGGGDPKQGRRWLRMIMAGAREPRIFRGPTPRPSNVRIATRGDEAAALDLYLQDLRDNADHVAPVDEEKCLENVRSGTRQRGGFVGVIDGEDGKPAAIVILIPQQWHWSQGWFLQEITAYVDPAHRSKNYFDDLMNFSKCASDELSRQMGVRVPLLCGVLGTYRVQEKIMLYRGHFTQVGAAFLYPAPHSAGD